MDRWFDDVTRAAGVDVTRVPKGDYRQLPDRMSGGVCVLDADGRGALDLFFAFRPWEGGGSRLYVADAPLDYRDETEARGLTDVGDALGCLAFDADGDRDDDLLVTGLGTIRLFENVGERFEARPDSLEIEPNPKGMYMSAATGDLDRDGDLDVVIAGNVEYDRANLPPEDECLVADCAVDVTNFDPIASVLLEQESDGRFVEATEALAPDLAHREPTLVVTVSDLDGDGRDDVYVGNDFGASYRDRALVADDEGVLRDEAARLGVDFDRGLSASCTMGVTHGDLDGNGVLDLARTSFEGDPTSVFLCGLEGPEPCVDHSREVGTDVLGDTFRWAAAFVDLDLDGWLDLFEATGHLLTEEEGDEVPSRLPGPQSPNLLRSWGEGELSVVEAQTGDGLAARHDARGLAVVDLDDDGRQDIVLATTRGRPAVLRNVRPFRGHWLRVVLRGASPNTGAVGAQVEVSNGERRWIRRRRAGEGYLGSFDPRLHFGLPEEGPYDLEVTWPNGATTRREGVGVDREIVIPQPTE